MRFKDTIKLAKKAQKKAKRNPNLYTEEELMYIRMMKRAAKKSLENKQHFKHKDNNDS